jgi:hypothetical protein
MIRLGLHVPETWLLPHKLPPDNPRYVPTAERYNPEFDLGEIGDWVGYPLYMKPFDGGMWVGVTRVVGPDDLHAAYEQSGELVAWCAFCSVSGRSMRLNQRTREYFEVGDRGDLGYEEKLSRYADLADAYFQQAEFDEFCATVLPHLEELTVAYVESTEFDDLVVRAIRLEVERERQEEMIERCRQLTREWAAEERAAAY